ncbi:hypothetical protein [Agrobacterium sp. 22-226-1]
MRPKKGTKAYKEEYIYIHYGIHMDTFEVVSIWERRDGRLSLGNFNHYTMPGRNQISEMLIVFGVSDVVSVPIGMNDANIRERLTKLAEEKKAERAAKDNAS